MNPSRRDFLRRLAAGVALLDVSDALGDGRLIAGQGRGETRYDMMIQGGLVVDPSLGLSAVRDVAISRGKIARVAPDIPRSEARQVINARGRIVTPGLIDIHVHVYDGVARFGISADIAGVARGVTSVIDGGSAGATTFPGFRKYIVNTADTRVFSLLNISSIGPSLSNELAALDYADVDAAVRTIEDNRDVIVGIKVRMTPNIENGQDLEAMRRALTAAEATQVPLMVHIGGSPSPLARILEMLRPGDVVTHAFRRRGSILDENGKVREAAREASERGVYFDIGHGAGNFSFDTAEQAIDQGVLPDVISSDIHQRNAAGPVFGLPTTLSKFLLLGLGIEQVIERGATTPARIFGLADRLGTLKEGADADVALFTMMEGRFEYFDSGGDSRVGGLKLQPFITIKSGKTYGSINV